MLRGAVFDADGTLLDSTAMWASIGERYLARLGIQAEPGLGKKLFPLSLPDAANYLIQTYGLTQTPRELADGVNEMVGEFYATEVQLKPGVLDFLRALKAKQIPMTVATATERVAIEKGLRHTGIAHFFQGIFTCTEVGVGKEAPDVYLAAAARLGADPRDTWVFEDALHGAQTAKAAGFQVAAVYDPVSERHREALGQVADLYLPDLRDFTGFYRVAAKGS